jgi:hypothetical protein
MHQKSSAQPQFPLWSEQTAAAYLAAMIDGEGTVTNAPGRRARQTRMVSISNTDPAIITATTACCDVLRLTYLVRTENVDRYPYAGRRRPIMHVRIHGRTNFQRLLDTVPIQAPEKRRRLEVIVASYITHAIIDPAEVRRLYNDERHTIPQVAQLLGVGIGPIRRIMREQGMRSRSHESCARAWSTRRSHNPQTREAA